MNIIKKLQDKLFKHEMRRQRAKYKISDDMSWNVDITLLEIIPKLMDKLVFYKHRTSRTTF